MMDRDQQRQNRRNIVSGFSCTAGAELNSLQNPAGRTGAACDPTPAAPVPFTAVSPTPCPAPLPVALNLPDGLIVPSDATIAYCPSTAGYSVTGTTSSAVTTGAQNQTILFTAIANITENQLNYLYQVVPGSSAAIIAAALSGATSSVITLTHLNYTQAEELISFVQDAKFTVNTLAVEQARNLLVCQVENNLQVASCPTSAYFGPSAGVPTGMMYVPSATSSTGAVLVTFALSPTPGNQAAFTLINIPSLTAAAAQANLLALAQAESSLRCVFGNAATAAACCTSQAPNNNLGYTAACVPATGPTIPGSATAIGYFSVAENTVFSIVSKAEANSVARELSRNSLNCYFPSDGITATCVGLGLTGPFAPTSTTSVYLEPGAVILYDTFSSVTAANTQATLIAQASLNCFWSNDQQTAYCPASPGFTAINNQYYILDASPTASINYSSTIQADTIISYESKTAANQQALNLATSSVSCVYCNNAILPTCSGGVNATIGAEADLICNVSAEVAQNTAISLGNILVSTSEGGLNCCYGNEGVTNTVKCTTGAYYSGNTSSAFTSADVFYIPANVITICAAEEPPPQPTLRWPYSNLYATNVAQVGCCSDILLCGGITGSVTGPLPTLWADSTDLFNVIATGATFYTTDTSNTAYAFPAGASYVVSRSGTRRYRAVTGGTGYTVGLTSCNNCLGLDSYVFRSSTASNYASASAAYTDIFCNGPTAQSITLYTNSASPFTSVTGAPVSWYLDSCGLSAFNPVSQTGSINYFYAGYKPGLTGYMIQFSTVGGNTSSFIGEHLDAYCPVSRYAYSVYIGSTGCSVASGATTLYSSQPAPAYFTSYTGLAWFYTTQFDDNSYYSYPSGTGYINYVAPDSSFYTRPINGIYAASPINCLSLYRTTVQWSNSSAADICNHPNYYEDGSSGNYNTNIRTLWCDVENPFASSATAIFYTEPFSLPENLFKPGLSGPVYLSKFTPGDTYRNSYRQYSWSNVNSTLKSYTGAYKSSPFITSSYVWHHSAGQNYMGVTEPGVGYTKFSYNGSCGVSLYSDIKNSLPKDASILDASYKTLPIIPIGGDLYSRRLAFDGVGYLLAAAASGTATQNTILLSDLSKIGAGFTGAIVRAQNSTYIGDYQFPITQTALPTYISSVNTISGAITLGGYYNKVNTNFSDSPIYVTGFKIDAGNWSGSQFTCYGEHCNKLEVGHSLFSYYVGGGGVTASIGYVTRIAGNTVYYTAAPGYDNFSSFDIGTGASHGSGHVYIQGRQFIRFWADDDKQQPIQVPTYNATNFIWADNQNSATGSYSVSKALIVGNTAGSTATFTVSGVNYANSNIIPRPYSYNGSIQYDYELNQYYYIQYVYSCDGAYTENIIPIGYTSVGYIGTCCDAVAPLGDTGNTTSACNYYAAFGNAAVDPSFFYGTINILSTGLAVVPFSTSPITGEYIISNSDSSNNGKFSANYYSNGILVGRYPCSSLISDPSYGDPNNGVPWSRYYLGYYDPDPIYGNIPFDPTWPPSGTALDNPAYWANNNPNNLPVGYIFKDYVPNPSVTGTVGCNCGNFTQIDYDLNSGSRYSIFSTTADAWNSVGQIGMISGNNPIMAFNECATGCSAVYTCTQRNSCDEGAPGLMAAPTPFAAQAPVSDVISFNPSSYDIPTLFNFGNMPSVGGTAEDLKIEATQVAQNIVNSFVRCFYFNDYQTGATCVDPTYYLVQQGFADPGEIVSNLSKTDANQRAKILADSRTVCLNPDLIGPGASGCEATTISNDVGSSNLGSVSLQFSKAGCSFNTNLSFNSAVSFQNVQLRQITVCSSTGASLTMYVPDWGGNVVGGVDIAYKPAI